MPSAVCYHGSMKTEYSLGFMHDNARVALIRKNRPTWQRGMWNGIGGHIEPSDLTPRHAMAREFLEEAGVETTPHDWEHVTTLDGPEVRLYFYAMEDDRVSDVRSMTEEKVSYFWIEDRLDNIRVSPGVEWILPLALERHRYKPFTVEFKGK